MAEAQPFIRTVLPDANVPASVRSNGVAVMHGPASDLVPILDAWIAAHADGTACVTRQGIASGTIPAPSRVRALAPELSKGLEFDLVVLIDPRASARASKERSTAMSR